MMKKIYKEYGSSFVLEATKLTSIVDKIHERLADYPQMTTSTHFEVFLSGSRTEELSTLNEVLAHENSRKHRIERLLINCSARTKSSPRPEHEISVDFGATKITKGSTGNTQSKIVEISISSDNAGWASRTLSDVEEQIERTWENNWRPFALLGAIAIVAIVFFVSNIVRIDKVPSLSDRDMWLTDANLERVQQIMHQDNSPITDAEMREIYTMQLENLLKARRPLEATPKGWNRKLVLLGIPFIVLMGCIVLLAFSYPHHVFLWGDQVDRYANVIKRRKIAWSIIIGLLVIGVATNLLSAGVAQWIPAE